MTYKAQNHKWTLFYIFCFVMFVKTMCFHWYVFHGVMLSSIFYHPFEFFRFWFGKIVPILFLGSFVFVVKNRWWTLAVNILIDLWIISNILYYKANGFFLSYEAIWLIDNMSGFWDSLSIYVGLEVFVYPVLSVIYFIMLIFFFQDNKNISIKIFSYIILISFLLIELDNFFYKKASLSWGTSDEIAIKLIREDQFHYYFPFGQVSYYAYLDGGLGDNSWRERYIKDQSIISYLPACLFFYAINPTGIIINLSDNQKNIIFNLINEQAVQIVPKNNLIVILWESLETWGLGTFQGYEYTPNLRKIINSAHSVFFPNVNSQVKYGNSADGQLIINTGLLPINSGATCYLYGDNKYPSLAECFSNSVLINPSGNVWNQDIITYSYNFKKQYNVNGLGKSTDSQIFQDLKAYCDSASQPFFALALTISSHTPFTHGKNHPKHVIQDMPTVMSDYLNCLQYTDSCVGAFIDYVKNSRLIENTTIVITGDHTIFRSPIKEFDEYASKKNIPMQTTKTYTPLIIYSPPPPLIDDKIINNEPCYQMDIYPTILNLIGCGNYYWHGLGINLFDTCTFNNRSISVDEAYNISDMIIKSDFFTQYYR